MMVNLRVSPLQSNGHDRLHVFDETGIRVAWYDRASGRIEIEDEQHRDAVLDALAPYLHGARTLRADHGTPAVSRSRPPVQAAPPLGTRRGGRVMSLLFGQRTEAARPVVGATAEEQMAARLARLTRHGWRLLDSERLSGGADVDHVLIGPPGVFTLITKHHPGSRVLVGARVVSINGSQQSYLTTCRQGASKVARLLTAACGFRVEVTPILAFAGASAVKATAPSPDVLVLRAHDIDRVLPSLPARLNGATTERIYAAASHQHTWLAG